MNQSPSLSTGAIGVFDSGYGGLTILDKIRGLMPEYDYIYLGYPSWWGTMPMCVWTFLENYNFSCKHIYPFCTHEGSGMGRSEKDIQKICPDSYIHTGLAIVGSQVLDSDNKIEEWLKGE